MKCNVNVLYQMILNIKGYEVLYKGEADEEQLFFFIYFFVFHEKVALVLVVSSQGTSFRSFSL